MRYLQVQKLTQSTQHLHACAIAHIAIHSRTPIPTTSHTSSSVMAFKERFNEQYSHRGLNAVSSGSYYVVELSTVDGFHDVIRYITSIGAYHVDLEVNPPRLVCYVREPMQINAWALTAVLMVVLAAVVGWTKIANTIESFI